MLRKPKSKTENIIIEVEEQEVNWKLLQPEQEVN